MLLHEELTYEIRGAAFKVYNTLGFGHKEGVYQKAFEEELKNQNIGYARRWDSYQKPVKPNLPTTLNQPITRWG